MKKIIIIFIIILSFFGLSFSFVNTQTTTPGFAGSEKKMNDFAKKLEFSDFNKSTENIVKNIMLLVNSLFFIFIIYAGILWMVSSGNENKIAKAKSILMWAIVGMVVTLSSYTITLFILEKIK